ncbi:MAG: FAD-dependent monooxygenase [Burkholderiaceae bacterium]|nr:FAD-dependent monooxygenase [Burkholderiaceae bacterium]MCD8517868.1 FAD-dependent monooxygenase [Burkholderiaceae bacterium]MCD8564899.1 FAD-dependent monooxygenase [Burkholderiaceae bacterium]
MRADVIVVGGGPCGLLTALLLGRQGINTLLLEKHPQTLNHPKAMGVTARTAEILRQIGLLDDVLIGQMARHADAVSQWLKGGLNGEVLGQSTLPKPDNRFSPCHGFHCPQPHVENVLREAVAQCSQVTCLYGAYVQDVSQSSDSVQVRFELNGNQQAANAKYLVAADGDQSFVRRRLGIERHGPGELGRFLSVYFKADIGDQLSGRLAYISNVLGADWFEMFVAVNGKDLWLMHHYLEGDETAGNYDSVAMQKIVASALGVADVDIDIISMNPWVMSPAIADRWREGRVFLVGDAAARVSPAGGLGMNNGLQSAHNLAWKLAHVIEGHQGASLLDSYEAERLPAARFTFENSSGNMDETFGIVMTALTGDWDKAREMIGRSRRSGAGYGQDFGIVYDSGAVLPDGTDAQTPIDVVNEYIEQARPGHRAPAFDVKAGGKLLSSIDMAGYQFVAWLGANANEKIFTDICPHARSLIEGRDFEAQVRDWKRLYGITSRGGVLVRPDGYVCARVS